MKTAILAAAILLGTALQARAADLLGSELTFTRAYPAPTTPFDGWQPVSRSTVVTADATDNILWIISAYPAAPYVTIAPGADTIAWQFINTGYIGSGDTFDGFVITGFDADIGAVSVLQASPGLDVQLSHTARELRVDLTGSGGFPPGNLLLSISVVPEPGVPAMLAAGLAALGLVRRSRRRG